MLVRKKVTHKTETRKNSRPNDIWKYIMHQVWRMKDEGWSSSPAASHLQSSVSRRSTQPKARWEGITQTERGTYDDSWFLSRDAMQARPMSSCDVCVSVTFVDSVKTNKHIINFFSPPDSHTVLVFPCQTA